MNVKDKKILIVGLGKTGISVSKFLTQKGARVTATDSNKELEKKEEVRSLTHRGVQLMLGYHAPEVFEQTDMIVLSPGVPHTLAPVMEARKKGVSVIGEIELASRFIKEPILAVTGTNGKTTTTTLLGEMLTGCGFNVFVGGNIGTPLIDYVQNPSPADRVVVEVSSFQLDTIESFRPTVGVLLNIAEDHMDRYEDFNAYAGAKCRLFENQKEGDIAIINGMDPLIPPGCTRTNKNRWIFSHGSQEDSNDTENRAVISETDIRFTINGRDSGTLKMDRVRLSGAHNRENVAAAGLAALAAGGHIEGIQSAVRSFKGLPHRLEYIATIHGVQYFNDSKATNAHAVEKALNAFTEPVILIMCGRNKDVDFHFLETSVREHVKKLIVFGEAEEAIYSALGSVAETERVASMKEAVEKAQSSAHPGEVVMLSPACASFDMYNNYAERGEDFRATVNRLE